MLIHGTALAVGGRGLILLGASGSGKSGLALRMMALGAQLVADDRVELSAEGGALIAAAPPQIAGLIEARGVGLLRVPSAGPTRVVQAVDLDQLAAARLPQSRSIVQCGVEIDLIFGRGVPNLDAVLMVLMQSGREAL